jgi:hypothetical protein
MSYDQNTPLSTQLDASDENGPDDLILEEAQNMANATNSDGQRAQIEFLTTQRGFSEEDIYNAAAGTSSDGE